MSEGNDRYAQDWLYLHRPIASIKDSIKQLIIKRTSLDLKKRVQECPSRLTSISKIGMADILQDLGTISEERLMSHFQTNEFLCDATFTGHRAILVICRCHGLGRPLLHRRRRSIATRCGEARAPDVMKLFNPWPSPW
jgi:hypothetical protein